MKSKFPLIIILAGLIIIGIGVWQFVDVKLETKASIKKAKTIIAEQRTTPLERTIVKGSEKNTISIPKPVFGDTIGLLQIPRIKAELAIVEGTDPNDLKKGVGHYKGSYFPNENGQIVLSGHSDTVFRHLGELKIGDTLKVKMPNGTSVYEITHTKIVDSKDTSIITLQHSKEELILTTCYPFRYVGNAPKRYIIYAQPKK